MEKGKGGVLVHHKGDYQDKSPRLACCWNEMVLLGCHEEIL